MFLDEMLLVLLRGHLLLLRGPLLVLRGHHLLLLLLLHLLLLLWIHHLRSTGRHSWSATLRLLLLLHQLHLFLLHLLHLVGIKSVLVDFAPQVVSTEQNVYIVGVENLGKLLV